MDLPVPLIIVVVLLSLPVIAVAQGRHDKCSDRCGNVSIPYPFGEEGCYLSPEFLINCSDSVPFLKKLNIEVLNISVDGQLEINGDVVGDCYYSSSDTRSKSWYINLSDFSISKSRNMFTVVGCGSYAYLEGYRYFEGKGKFYNYGCMSRCADKDFVDNSTSCSGGGCCQVEIPEGLYNANVTAYRFNDVDVSNFNPCTYALIVEESKFNFTFDYLQDMPEEFPMVLEWTINNETNHCKDHATKYQPDNIKGYRCKCHEGYHGNPYLGCTDINECEEGKHDCTDIFNCINKDGYYTCGCPDGYNGDGRKYGKGCQRNRLQTKMIILLGCGSGLGILLLLIGLWSLYKITKRRRDMRLKQKFFKRNGGLLLEQQLSATTNHVEQTKVFNSRELEKATDNFHMNRILGHGGQGTVYKGMLTDGRVVAIKKSKILDEDRLDNFINEVVILSQINHRNVVKLIGCCLETEVPLLVFEFIPNGTLFQYIHNPNEEFSITWEMRLRIATEIADALAYLHSAASIPIYHRDVKSSNILLDEKFRAKVADFGISRSISIDQTHVTTQVQGTFGYLDPEYFQSSQFTEKSDVYSFGVVLVELLTGQKPISSLRSIEERNLARYFLVSMEENRLFEILDARVLKEGGKEEVIAMAKLVEKCLNLNGKKRPTMKTVVVELEGIRASQEASSTINQQDYDEFDHTTSDFTTLWNVASSSTGSLNSSTIHAR